MAIIGTQLSMIVLSILLLFGIYKVRISFYLPFVKYGHQTVTVVVVEQMPESISLLELDFNSTTG